jgi:hypothetical protein
MLIDDERLETALKRLAKTDALAAELHMKVERAEYKAKAIKDANFLLQEGSVAERQAKAGVHPDYSAAMDDYFAALQAHDTMKNERSREVIVIECWRSLNSARSKGLVT